MYQRKYPDTYSIPENYSGIAMEDHCDAEDEPVGGCPLHTEEYEIIEGDDLSPDARGGKWTDWKGRFLSFFKRLPFHLPRFEGEDFLLIGAALLLFFSKNGDKECALILLALLFIG